MSRRSKLWRVATWLYVLINAGGAVFAFAQGERMHGELHIALLLLGGAGYLIWRLNRQANQQNLAGGAADPRLDYLQQSVDAMALEVERIGEAQRFNERLKAERAEISPPPKKEV